MDAAVRRMRGGVALLESDAKVYEAFQLANRSMLDQMRQSNRIRKQEDELERDSSGDRSNSHSCLRSLSRQVQRGRSLPRCAGSHLVSHRRRQDRSVLRSDGVRDRLATVRAWRQRRRHQRADALHIAAAHPAAIRTVHARHLRLGVATAQRARAAGVARRSARASGSGRQPAPTRSSRPRKQRTRSTKALRFRTGLVVDACPWCGADFDGRNYRATENEFRLHCVSPDCDFGRNPDLPLPCNVVDDGLYAEPPSLLIGTIDKFARLPWTSRAGAFFGDGSRRAPELVIQDELHLITGPLGSVAGLYEAGLETLLQIRGVRPKYVASTATIRMAKEQVRRLYGRDLAVFPPAGLSCDDCYFARTQHDRPGRLYVGYLARMLDQRHCLAPLAAALLAAPLELFRDQAEKDALLEAWWTQVVYHSSLRAVTDSSNAYAVGVRDWIRRLAGESIASAKEATSEPSTSPASDPSGDTSRERVDNVSIAQLTSLATPKDIARTFSRLERGREDSDHLDVVLSHEYGVGRLGRLALGLDGHLRPAADHRRVHPSEQPRGQIRRTGARCRQLLPPSGA